MVKGIIVVLIAAVVILISAFMEHKEKGIALAVALAVLFFAKDVFAEVAADIRGDKDGRGDKSGGPA